MQQYQGVFPLDPDVPVTLPGIGQSTANAICSIVGNLPVPILDANAKRVIMRYHNITDNPNQAAVKNVMAFSATISAQAGCNHYTQAIMDLGANICIKNLDVQNVCARCCRLSVWPA